MVQKKSRKKMEIDEFLLILSEKVIDANQWAILKWYGWLDLNLKAF